MLLFVFFIKKTALAQTYNTVNGVSNRQILTVKNSYGDLEGSPYFSQIWLAGTVKFFALTTTTTQGEFKYDQLEDLLIVRGKDGAENMFSEPVHEFTLIGLDGLKWIFRNGFATTGNTTDKTYFEVVYDGKTKILKKTIKSVIVSKGYNSAAIRKVDSSVYYFIVMNNDTLTPIKTSQKSIVLVLNKPELVNYIKENNLDLKKDSDLIKLLTFFDSL